MNRELFQPGAPGSLVTATGFDRIARGERLESVPIRGLAFVPNSLPPTTFVPGSTEEAAKIDRDRFVGGLIDALTGAGESLVRLEGAVGALPNPNVLLHALRKREVQRSSTIENTIASIQEISQAEVTQIGLRAEVAEVFNNLRAVEAAIESELPLSNRLICDAHRTLLSGVRGNEKKPGCFRETQVHITGRSERFADARFVPPPPGEALLKCMRDLELFMNPESTSGPRLHWLIELAMIHYQFEAIHPFSDGNGRLGRMLVNVAPVKRGHLRFPIANISEYFADRKQVYYDALLRVSTHNDWRGWVEVFCTAVESQARADLIRARFLASLREDYFAKFTDARSSVLVHELIELLFQHPIVTAREVQERLDISAPAAQSHINRLTQAGMLQEITGKTTNRLYAAQRVLWAIDASLDQLAASRAVEG